MLPVFLDVFGNFGVFARFDLFRNGLVLIILNVWMVVLIFNIHTVTGSNNHFVGSVF
ncbi:hypothetical protein LEP1GSC106_5066 [Leptospira interrogans serovar Grippotyphosa str. UI 12764]|nr:hypothetical protein LEP1GSC106_5066 [Leptospira interrogans serovar Grippotyphosa str. UI 12764]